MAPVVAETCLVLTSSPPSRPPPDMIGILFGGQREFGQQTAHLGHRVVDQPARNVLAQAVSTGSRPFAGVPARVARVADNQANVSMERVMCAYQAR
jgi:hypothetical protein